MQLLVLRHPIPVALWTPEFDNRREVWLTTIQGNSGINTIASSFRALSIPHLACSRKHFFQINISQETFATLVAALLKRLTADTANPTRDLAISPSEVEERAVIVYQAIQETTAQWYTLNPGPTVRIDLLPEHRRYMDSGSRGWILRV